MVYPTEAWLVAGAFAFYLFDAWMLLFVGDLVLEQAAGGWRAHPGAAMLVGGRRPFLPSPFAPQRPLLLVSLAGGGAAAGPRHDLRHFVHALAPFQACAAALLGLFVLLPAVLYYRGVGPLLLGWLACVYALAGAIAWQLFRRRRVLELTSRQAAALAFECVACAPLAINIVRKLGLRRGALDLAQAEALVGPAAAAAFRRQVGVRLDAVLDTLDPDAPAAAALVDVRRQLDHKRLEPGATP